MNDLDLNDVRTFVSVAQAGTLTAAAKEMACPVSTVSRALTRLEKHLAVLLVHRGPRGLVLTDAGKEYLQSCRRALQSLQHGREVLEGHRSSPSGLLKVACPVTMARDAIAPLLKEFLERYPELRVEIEPYAASWDQEPRDDVDVFFKLRAPKDSLRRVRPYPGTVRGLFASQNYLKDAGDLSTPDDLPLAQLRRLRTLEVEQGQKGGNARYSLSSGYERSDGCSETRPGWVWYRHSSVVDGEKSGSSKGSGADSAAVGPGADHSLCAILERLTADAKSASAAGLSRRIPGNRS